ncbi:PBS lyase HEAT domain protein repeat-containing protein [Pedosphaera parvula Ellin514]|uniref:PBS lyase HEAT domain protein repeat-containing protein n=2 Tax=Pedosphaera TaxID=1032526 RepID=B9XQN1_PEDPL|nr:PBS lyase HEAT domain protein repeat-containing protein [Pedosphaera parvula Ellin514]
MALKPSDPLYNGKRLSHWMEGYYVGTGAEGPSYEDTQNALVALGTNSIPTLVQMLREEDSPIKIKLVALSKKYNFSNLHLVRAQVKHAAAVRGFHTLGVQAQCAAPALIASLQDDLSIDSRVQTLNALALLGPSASGAIPLLVRDSSHTNEHIRASAIMALGFIHAEPEASIPLLIKALTDNSVGVRILAAQSLGYYGSAAQSAVPALILALQDRFTREAADRSLDKIDPEEAFLARMKMKPRHVKSKNHPK